MAVSSITRSYIEIDRKNNPNKYISIQNALQSKEEYYFELGILSDYLEKQGVITAIEKKYQNQLSKKILNKLIINASSSNFKYFSLFGFN